MWKPDVLAKLSNAAWQLLAFHGQSTLLTLLPTRMGRPFCRVRMIGELLAMPLAHGAVVASKALKRIIGASK
jgi:hypothetical protein